LQAEGITCRDEEYLVSRTQGRDRNPVTSWRHCVEHEFFVLLDAKTAIDNHDLDEMATRLKHAQERLRA